MLSWIVTRFRFFGTITLVALYAICVVMPSAMASPSGSTPSHCQIDDHHRIANGRLLDGIHIHRSIQVHGGGAMDQRAGNSMKGGDGKSKRHDGACCGLFCCAAITGDSALGLPVQASLVFRALDERLDGHGPKRIGRPPKSFSSL
ncbi:MAG: hypothetical protein L0Y57_00585 [Beijerinckiaceae bacterium]|nr:hypothetical protein [Beijerinckiaceae bacterium]